MNWGSSVQTSRRRLYPREGVALDQAGKATWKGALGLPETPSKGNQDVECPERDPGVGQLAPWL